MGAYLIAEEGKVVQIVVLDGYTENPGDLSWEGLCELGELTVYDRTSTADENEIIARIGYAEIILTNKTPITASAMDACPNIRYIGVLATGYNIVDVAAAKDRGILVTNIPAYGTEAVAQFAIALLLEICHHIGHHSDAVHNGAWENSKDFCFWDYPLIELAGKTLGIIGFGRIGQATGRIAAAMGMKILVYDPYLKDAINERGCTSVGLDELFRNSDIIALHCPLLPETTGIICKATIEKMKDGVIIINNSRGPLINEQDLADALNNGKVYAAGLDVVSTEPIKGDNPLLTAKNCIITPHISWAARESRQRLMNTAVENIRQYLAGTPVNVVNL